MRTQLTFTALCLLVACDAPAATDAGASPDAHFEVTPRADGDRSPASAACDVVDPGRCLLPWPSNTFTVRDEGTATGLRLAVGAESLNPRDDASSLAHADGFSRVSPLLALFERPLDEATLEAGVHLHLAQHDHPDRGAEVPLRIEVLTIASGETLVLADPRQVLEANADYVVVITDALRAADGEPLEAPAGTRAALGLTPPRSAEEAAAAGYHAPTRRLLETLGVDAASVLRAWDFTTRSAGDPRAPLEHMRRAAIEAVDDGRATVEIDRVEIPDDPAIALVAYGDLVGLPTFLDEAHAIVRDAAGTPVELGRTAAPFRVLIPAGDGDYPYVMYGHGTGGNERDGAFDAELGAEGLAKVGVRLYGWTDDEVILTFTSLQRAFAGSLGAASYLVEALAHAAAIDAAMAGPIADALAAETLVGAPNPAAGRRPDRTLRMWVGGSLGGTTGIVYGAADPEVEHAVVNVPGAAWSQWVWHSETFDIIYDLLSLRYEDDVDLALALSIAQTNLDLADGASWTEALAEHPTAFLLQESMGDPILPNPGTEIAAVAVGARHVGGVLEPIVGVSPADEVVGGSGLTQFRVPAGDRFAVHGFAARDTPAGVAAREQMLAFVRSVRAGAAVIAPPPSCPTRCDFTE